MSLNYFEQAIRRLWCHFSKRRKRQFVLLVALLIIGAFSEIFSIGAVVPFLSVLVSPTTLFSLSVVRDISHFFGFTSANDLVLPFTVIFVLSALIAGFFRLLIMWANMRFSYAAGHDLSVLIYRNTLYQPYNVHIARNSSEVISAINKVQHTIQMLSQAIEMLKATIVSLAIFFAMVIIDPLVSTVTFAGFATCYFTIAWITRNRVSISGQHIAFESTRRIKILQEGLGGAREVLLNGSQSFFVEAYRSSDWQQRKAQGWNQFLQLCPKYALEAFGMAFIAILAYVLSVQVGGLGSVLPMLGALALGAQRLLPSLQQIYAAWISIHGSLASVNDTIQLIEQPIAEGLLLPPPSPLDFKNEICLQNVFFRYSPEGTWILNDLCLVIPKGSRVGVVGGTGSGKSTTIDLLMGLLPPDIGEVKIDGSSISGEGDRLRAWQRLIAHVPQHLFLTDSTVAENIAFGEQLGEIDIELVRRAAQQAKIDEFIESTPAGYYTLIGERGIRVSGGQRQRIVIARALYKRATVLVFDEATSALDNTTERAVMDAIEELGRDLTILIVAHRLSTVKYCDFIIEMEQGRIVAKGTYDQLLSSSKSFQGMVR